MPLRILKLRTLTGSGVIRGLLIIGMFSTFFIGALYFEHVLGYSPVKTGLAFLPQARRPWRACRRASRPGWSTASATSR